MWEPLVHGQPQEPHPRQADTLGGGSRASRHMALSGGGRAQRGPCPARRLRPGALDSSCLWARAAGPAPPSAGGVGPPEAAASTRPQREAGAGLPALTLLRLGEGGQRPAELGPGAAGLSQGTVFSPLLPQVRACLGAPRPRGPFGTEEETLHGPPRPLTRAARRPCTHSAPSTAPRPTRPSACLLLPAPTSSQRSPSGDPSAPRAQPTAQRLPR